MGFSGMYLAGFKEVNPGACSCPDDAAWSEVCKHNPVQFSEVTLGGFKIRLVSDLFFLFALEVFPLQSCVLQLFLRGLMLSVVSFSICSCVFIFSSWKSYNMPFLPAFGCLTWDNSVLTVEPPSQWQVPKDQWDPGYDVSNADKINMTFTYVCGWAHTLCMAV